MVGAAWGKNRGGLLSLSLALSACVGVSAFITVGCGLVTRTQRMFGGRLPLEVTIEPRANQGSAVAVDVLMVYDKGVLDKILALTARAWFEQQSQLERDFPGAFDRARWEWVPGQQVGRQEIEYRAGAKAAVVFADYLTPGAHRLRLDPRAPSRLLLGETGFTAEPLAPEER